MDRGTERETAGEGERGEPDSIPEDRTGTRRHWPRQVRPISNALGSKGGAWAPVSAFPQESQGNSGSVRRPDGVTPVSADGKPSSPPFSVSSPALLTCSRCLRELEPALSPEPRLFLRAHRGGGSTGPLPPCVPQGQVGTAGSCWVLLAAHCYSPPWHLLPTPEGLVSASGRQCPVSYGSFPGSVETVSDLTPPSPLCLIPLLPLPQRLPLPSHPSLFSLPCSASPPRGNPFQTLPGSPGMLCSPSVCDGMLVSENRSYSESSG